MAVPKRKKSRLAADAAALTSFLAAQQSTSPARPQDPALIAATILLAHALDAVGASFAEAGRDGTLITVSIPDGVWTPLVRDAWQTSAREGRRPVDGHNAREWDRGDWYSWSPDELPTQYNLRQQPVAFSRAVASLRHCAGFAPDLSWLPIDLVS